MHKVLASINKIPPWVLISALGFIVLNTVLIAMEFFYLPLLPLVLLLGLIAFARMDILLMLIVFCTPLSLLLSNIVEGVGVDLYLPTEPLLALLLIIYFLRFLQGKRSDIRILRHPVTVAIYFHLAWMALTIITSSDPLISFKFFISRLWFIIGFYLVAIEVFRDEKRMRNYIWLYIASFSVVIIYTLIRHSAYGLENQMMAHSMMQPFYKDHTSYGATLAFLLPALIAFFVGVKRGDTNQRFLIILLIILYLAATLFSYTRAAWISLIGGLGIWIVIKLKIRLEIITLAAAALVVLFFIFQPMIMLRLEDNRTKSSGDIAEHVQSISNISNDQSNLERINRWSCAIRMWKERPVFGFGPGTYQFQYGRFQRSFEKTEISTDFGTRGTAHSEYLGPLSESGLLGMLSILLIVGTTIYTGVRVWLRMKPGPLKSLAIGLLIGLITYYIHGILNNFLDTDKASPLFWGYTAMLVAMDLFHTGAPNQETQRLE